MSQLALHTAILLKTTLILVVIQRGIKELARREFQKITKSSQNSGATSTV